MRLYDAEEPPSTADVTEAIRPTVSAHFKPALLARMTMVPFKPIGPDIMREIAILKLRKLERRLMETHEVEAILAKSLLEFMADGEVPPKLEIGLSPEAFEAASPTFVYGPAPTLGMGSRSCHSKIATTATILGHLSC